MVAVLNTRIVAMSKVAKVAKEPKAKWTSVRGKLLDLSEFKHPGGNIIEFFYGQDATTAFESFHGHSKDAQRMLAALPQLETKPDQLPVQPPAQTAAMSRMLLDWRKRGLFKPRPLVSGAYGLAVVATIVLSWCLAPTYPVVGGLTVGLAWAHCGFLQHMGGHHELGGLSLPWQNFFEGLCKGGSGTWWRNRHNKHHAKTNVLGEDGDLRTTPFFAWDTTLARQVPDWSLRTQAWTFLPALSAYVFIFAFSVRKFAMVRRLHVEVALMVAHYAIFALALRLAGCSLGAAVGYYCVGYAFQGMYLGFFFGLSHFAMERVPSTATWLESSMHGTVDWAGASAFAGYVSGFLNVQIEHHMAPQMPMENLRLIRADCKALAQQFELPYREVSFVAALKLMFGGLQETGRAELKRRHAERAATKYAGAAMAVLGELKAD